MKVMIEISDETYMDIVKDGIPHWDDVTDAFRKGTIITEDSNKSLKQDNTDEKTDNNTQS